jgi:hypothetical protein
MNSTAAITTISHTSKRFRSLLVAAILIATIPGLGGCANELPIDAGSAIRQPGVGSSFVYKTLYHDNPIEHYDTMRVIRTRLTFGGRMGVTEMKYGEGNSGHYEYYSYGEDGSISVARTLYRIFSPADTLGGVVWFTFAVAPAHPTTASGTLSVRGLEQNPVITVTPQGADTVLVGTTRTGAVRYFVSDLADPGKTDEPVYKEYWLASTLGVFARIEIVSQDEPVQSVLVASNIR